MDYTVPQPCAWVKSSHWYLSQNGRRSGMELQRFQRRVGVSGLSGTKWENCLHFFMSFPGEHTQPILFSPKTDPKKLLAYEKKVMSNKEYDPDLFSILMLIGTWVPASCCCNPWPHLVQGRGPGSCHHAGARHSESWAVSFAHFQSEENPQHAWGQSTDALHKSWSIC